MKLFDDLEAQHGLPSGLLNAVMQQESRGNTRAVSPKGARGAFQFMPATAEQYGVDVNDLTSSAKGAARMYSDLLKQHGGDLQKALAGYNWGSGNVQRQGMDKMPAETRQYIQKVTANMQPQIDKTKIVWDAPQIDKSQIKWDATPAAANPETILGMDKGKLEAVGGAIKDAAGGFTRSGMGLVSNLMRPIDALTGANDPSLSSLITGKPAPTAHEQRMARVEGRFKDKGYDPQSTAFQAGKLGGDIAATAPIGGALAKGVGMVSQAPKAVALANALRTGGMTTGLPKAATLGGKAADMGIRMAGGAVTGGAMGLAVDPEHAGTAAAIGGALPPALKVAGALGTGIKNSAGVVVRNALGASTGTGAESIRAAYQAGKNKSADFIDNMRGNSSFNDVVDKAKGALQNMRIARGNDYRSGMVDIANDKAVIDFKPIADAVSKVSSMGSYKGQKINKNAAGTVNELSDAVSNWAGLNPAEYHTPEGLDALKQAIGDIRDGTQFGTAARRSADTVYNAVKDQITAQAPTYAKVMKDYSEASTALKEVEKALSLGDKASKDTAIRKLQSLLRNNAQTSYGNRLDLARNLEDKGGVNLLSSIAGQSMNSAMPRGMVGAIEKGGAVMGAIGSGGASIPLTIAAAPFTSPRLVGESLYGIGRAVGGVNKLAGKGQQAVSQLASQHPGMIEGRNALYRSVPLMASQANR